MEITFYFPQEGAETRKNMKEIMTMIGKNVESHFLFNSNRQL